MNKVITLITALLLFANTSFAATTVSGQIRANTTWTKAGSPYICTGLIEVDSFSTLTIEPGTVIDLDNGLIVYNSIVFMYNTTDTTVIKTHNSNAYREVAIQNPNNTNTIVLKRLKFIGTGMVLKYVKSNVLIEECSFNTAHIKWYPLGTGTQTFTFKKNRCISTEIDLSTNGSSPSTGVEKVIIDSNYFDSVNVQYPISGQLYINKAVEITNNIFRNIPSTAIRISAGEQIISNNIFYKVGYAFLHWPGPLPVRIHSNIFTECDVAIFLNGIGDTVEIQNNSFYNNNIGISVSYHYTLPGGSAPRDNIRAPIVEGNCFYNNKMTGFAWNAKNSISIGANWWGSVDTNKIDSAIIDNKDDFKIGHVNYKPYLTISNPSCKTYTPPLKTETLLARKNEIQLFPNPFLNTLVIKSGSPIKTAMLYNIVGEIVYKSTAQNNSISVNTEEFPAGVYLYKIITDDNTVHTGKVIKQ